MVRRMTRKVLELFDLHGRVALVTGGSRGLGLQIAGALGEAGATVVLSARKQPELDDACGVLCTRGISAHAIAGDASQPDAIERICSTAVAEHGKVDILVNNAGATWGAPAEDHPIEAWDKVMNVNVRGVFLFSQYRLVLRRRLSSRFAISVSRACRWPSCTE